MVKRIINRDKEIAMSLKQRFLLKKHVLYRLALRMLQNHHDAEDAVSDVFLRIWQKKEKIDNDHLEKILIVSMKNHCIDVIRKRKQAKKIRKYFSK